MFFVRIVFNANANIFMDQWKIVQTLKSLRRKKKICEFYWNSSYNLIGCNKILKEKLPNDCKTFASSVMKNKTHTHMCKCISKRFFDKSITFWWTWNCLYPNFATYKSFYFFLFILLYNMIIDSKCIKNKCVIWKYAGLLKSMI